MDLPDPEIRPECPGISALVERFFTTESPGKDGRVPFNLDLIRKKAVVLLSLEFKAEES